MGLFPQQFIEDLKQQADIVVVIQDYVSLKKSGATYKGLCPFHGERTPSFHVNRDKGFFHCFGCSVGGDVFKFVELQERVGFLDAVKHLAQRFGVPMPELEQTDQQRADAAERETLLNVHEAAAAWFRHQLAADSGARVRAIIAERGLTPATTEALGLGFAPAGREGVAQALMARGFSQTVLLRAGLIVQRDDGAVVDRFRNRLIIPICRDSGSVIAFGGRAIDADQQPKYLNSPETPLYSKGRTLFGLNLSKTAIRQGGFAVLVEGYFDFAQLYQAGVHAVVASCGTALTPQQARHLRRFTSKVVLSFDADTAGQGAAQKSCEMLVAEGFDVNIALLPSNEDPDTFVRSRGVRAYGERLKQSQPYLEYLLDRASRKYGGESVEARARLISELVPVAARIPDRVKQELFMEAVSARTGVSGDLILREVRKAGLPPTSSAGPPPALPSLNQVTKAEKGLIWMLIHQPDAARPALGILEDNDLEGLAAGSVLDLARKLDEDTGFSSSVLLERLSVEEAQLVTGVASEMEPPVRDAEDCARLLKRLRYERERSALQREIDRLQQLGAEQHGAQIDALWARKRVLLQQMEGLT
jgi:DNA primase